MKKQSAGILLYRKNGSHFEVLLGHAGGPFWKKKDLGAWSLPKGEYGPEEDPQTAACREFQEETGQPVPEGARIDLGSMKRKDGKTITVWAVEGTIDEKRIASNTFEMEWPPRSGRMEAFPEIDRAAWYPLAAAGPHMHQEQAVFIERLADHLGIDQAAQIVPEAPQQTTLL
jgi:predicted NUDIX family NTP pyrophosphohydrolase